MSFAPFCPNEVTEALSTKPVDNGPAVTSSRCRARYGRKANWQPGMDDLWDIRTV